MHLDEALLVSLIAWPILGLLIAFTAVTVSWRWAVGFIVVAGAVLFYFWSSQGPINREHTQSITIAGALLGGLVIASVIYGAGLIWFWCRKRQ
jgi:hypothetical protein